MKVSTVGGKPLISGGKVVVTPGGPCACGDCGGGPTPTLPCCPGATLVCDQISASSGSCGFSAFDGSGRKFKTYSWSTTGSFTAGPPLGCTGTASGSWSASGTRTKNLSGCTETCSCSGSGSATINFGPPDPFHICDSANCSGTLTASSCGGSSGNPCGGSSGVVSSTECSWTGSGCPGGAAQAYLWSCNGGESSVDTNSATEQVHHYDHTFSGGSQTATKTVTLSDELTNDCDNAIASLPPYPGTYSGSCDPASSRNSTDSGCSITRSKYKWTFESPLEQDCTINWIERTYDSDGNPISDEAFSEDLTAGSTESSVHEVLDPSENGHISVLPITACCVGADCSLQTAEDCASMGGESTAGCGCVTDGCLGACCDYSGDPTCSITDSATCNANPFAVWLGVGTTCDPPPC